MAGGRKAAFHGVARGAPRRNAMDLGIGSRPICGQRLPPSWLERISSTFGTWRAYEQPMSVTSGTKRLTITKLQAMKAASRRITMLTAYDYPTARLLDESGVDSILVGDSLSMVVQGHSTTLPVTVDQMIYHAEMVSRAVKRALVIVDMPFLSFQVSVSQAIENAGRILKETSCQAVKIEGGVEQAETVRALVSVGIPVLAHVGLRPQNIHQLGGYRVQREEEQLLADAQAAEEAGAFGVVLECIPADIAQRLSSRLTVPTIGIGAGAGCDGQVLVVHDMLGWATDYVPKHAKQYANVADTIRNAVRDFCSEVRDGSFPADEHTFS